MLARSLSFSRKGITSSFRLSSSDDSGSSRSSSRGEERSARPMATRCFSPPERAAIPQCSKEPRSRRSTTSSKEAWSRGSGEDTSVSQVALHREMGKEAVVLKDVADAPAMGRNENARAGIQENRAIDRDATALGTKQSGNHVENAGFARARRTEDGCHPAFALEVRVKSRTRRDASLPKLRGSYRVKPAADALGKRFGDEDRSERDRE